MDIIQEMGRSYLIIDDVTKADVQYMARMLTDNHIPGILQCKKGLYQNRNVLKYDITNMRSVRSEYSNRMMSFKDVAELLYDIADITISTASYLLDEGYFSYLPDFIYLDMEYNRPYMLYIPFECAENNAEGRYYGLADFLLEKLDHKEEAAVSIAYQFYRMSKEPLFSLQGFCSIIDREKNERQIEYRAEILSKEKAYYLDREEAENVDIDISRSISKNVKRDNSLIKLIISGIITIILVVVYLLIGKGMYGIYSLMLLILSLFTSGIVTVIYLYRRYKNTREDRLLNDMPDNPVTVKEFWGGDEKTVFFDEETQFFEPETEKYVIEWTEDGKEKREILKKDTAFIGKKYDEVDVCISDPTISRKHARITIKGNGLTLQDLGSTNGTFFEGRKIEPGEEVRLLKNQDFVLGKVAVRVV